LAADRAGEWSAVAADRAEDLRKQAGARVEDVRQQFLASKAYDTLKDAVPAIAKLDNRKQRRANTTLWLLGAGVGLLAAGVIAFVIARRQMATPGGEPLVELPREGVNADGTDGQSADSGPAATASPAMSGLRAAAKRAGIDSIDDIQTASNADKAPIVGNIHTKMYQDATQVNALPAEDNRIYFADEAEARAAGYRPAQPTAVEHTEFQTPTA
jgi:hypothetical protein